MGYQYLFFHKREERNLYKLITGGVKLKKLSGRIFSGKIVNWILIVMLLFFTSFVNAGKLEEIKEDIEKTSQLLKEEETLHQKEREQALATQRSLQERIVTLENRIKQIGEENKRLKREINGIESVKKKLMMGIQKNKSLFSSIGDVLSDQAEILHQQISSGIPYAQEDRLRRVIIFKRKLKEGDIDIVDGCQELYYDFLEEIDLGYGSELYFDEVETTEGEMKRANFLRIGKTVLAYRTKDGKETGLLQQKEEGYKWQKGLLLFQRRKIKKSIEIMEGRRIPRLIDYSIDWVPPSRNSDYND